MKLHFRGALYEYYNSLEILLAQRRCFWYENGNFVFARIFSIFFLIWIRVVRKIDDFPVSEIVYSCWVLRSFFLFCGRHHFLGYLPDRKNIERGWMNAINFYGIFYCISIRFLYSFTESSFCVYFTDFFRSSFQHKPFFVIC